VVQNESNTTGGLINLDAGGLLGTTASNTSDGTSNITTGAATAAGNQAANAVNQQCLQPVAGGPGPGFRHSPPIITPGFRPDVVVRPPAVLGQTQSQGQSQTQTQSQSQIQPQTLARTGNEKDPFVMGLVAFALLFGGLMFLVWERVEAYPVRRTDTA
jgi:hypothetical protein